ncbi:unnamed protein product [Amoebophrya sp. A25]|nr:unnamed protein product [Amoebophrya sp. A25]|eukprot:GSA25T00009247001.1
MKSECKEQDGRVKTESQSLCKSGSGAISFRYDLMI